MNWVAQFGNFEFTNGGKNITFAGGERLVPPPTPVAANPGQGEAEPEPSPTRLPDAGLAVSNRWFAEGRISATVTFVEIEQPATEDGRYIGDQAEIVLGFEPAIGIRLVAGIGGVGRSMFGIREYVLRPPKPGDPEGAATGEYVTIASGGTKRLIRPAVPYHLEVTLKGSRVSLSVDGVLTAVGETTVISPGQQRQAGIFAASYKQITVDNYTIQAERPRAFVVMKFSPAYEDIYAKVIKDICEKFDLDAIRADEIYGPGFIIRDIIQQVVSAQLIIADVSEPNANVYFEVGYALALKKPIILLAKRGTELPFDIAGFRVLFYDDSIGGKTKIEEGLTQHLSAIMGGERVPQEGLFQH